MKYNNEYDKEHLYIYNQHIIAVSLNYPEKHKLYETFDFCSGFCFYNDSLSLSLQVSLVRCCGLC